MRLRPLPRAAIALSVGILAVLRVPIPLLATSLVLGLLLAGFIEPERRRSAILLIVISGLGAVMGHRAAERVRADCRVSIPDGAEIAAEGVITVAPGPETAGMMRLERIRQKRGSVSQCRGEVRVRLRARLAREGGRVPVGARVEAWGGWRANPISGEWPRPPEWAGSFVIDSIRVTVPPAPARSPILALRASVQRQLRLILPEQHSMAEALILSRKEGLDREQRDRFARAGLAHLLAISGFHVGLIAGVLLLLGGAFRLSPRATAVMTVVTTVAYVLFLGVPHAASRAALQITLALAGRIWQRAADPFSLIATAAIVLLIRDPLALLDPGFQLSFAGTAGIIALRRRFLDAIPRMSLPRAVHESIAVSIAATLATAPFTVLHFGQIAPVGVIANLAAIPITGAAVPGIVVSLLASYISLPAGRFLAGGVELLLSGLDLTARAAAAVPGGQLLVPRDTILGWALAATLAALLSTRLGRRKGAVRPLVRRVVAGGTVMAVLIAWPSAVKHLHDGRLEVHAIDVGQGDAFAVRTPGGHWILIDTGPAGSGYDAGRARVVPFLLRNGARRIDALILTHPDADHIGGANAVLESFNVGLVVDPGVAMGRPLYREVMRRAQDGRLRWVAARPDLDLSIDGVGIRVLGVQDELDESRTANQLSVAFRLDYGRFSALFLGDAPAEVEEMLVVRHGSALDVDLLKVAHHGSKTSTSEALLETARPRLALISAGRRNRFGHPAPIVLERLERYDVEVLRTDLAGTITLRTGPEGEIQYHTER